VAAAIAVTGYKQMSVDTERLLVILHYPTYDGRIPHRVLNRESECSLSATFVHVMLTEGVCNHEGIDITTLQYLSQVSPVAQISSLRFGPVVVSSPLPKGQVAGCEHIEGI